MLKIILFIHIVGAVTIFGFMTGSLWAVYKKIENQYSKLAKIVALNFALQLISGSALTYFSLTNASILTFCGKIAFYVLSVAIVEGILFYQMRRNNKNSFPALAIFNSSAVGLAAVIFTIIFRF